MATYGKKKYGCLKYILFAVAIVFAMAYTFIKLAPKTSQKAKEEVIEDIFGVSTTHNDNDTLKTVIINKIDSIKIEKRDTSVIVIPVELTMHSAFIMTKVNGVDMRFMIDTGCSDMQITSAEFFYMKHLGLVDEKDIIDKQTFEYADGNKGECHVLNIKSVVIGGIEVKNVNASIQENSDAALLLGQSVLEKLGEVSIDYSNKQLKVKR
jgi:aspartyl protease family protein